MIDYEYGELDKGYSELKKLYTEAMILLKEARILSDSQYLTNRIEDFLDYADGGNK